MKNFLKKLNNKFDKKATVTKVDNGILDQRPDILLSDLENLKYSISTNWEPKYFMYDNKSFEKQNLHNRIISPWHVFAIQPPIQM